MVLNKSVILLFILCSFSGISHAAFKTHLTDVQIESALQNSFPVKEYAAVARITLQQPKVQLRKNAADLALVIPVDIKIMGDTLHHGHIALSAKLNYQSISGGLYLKNPRVDQLEFPTISKGLIAELRDFILMTVKNSISLVRIYTLKEQDLNHSLKKSTLKHFRVDEGRVHLEFGFK